MLAVDHFSHCPITSVMRPLTAGLTHWIEGTHSMKHLWGIASIATVILLVMKLAGVGTLTWLTVFTPWLFMAALSIFLIGILIFVAVVVGITKLISQRRNDREFGRIAARLAR